ncbi:hypothetical protein [Actinoplanes couchii]|uniref:Uncharacterized protein n=1 Tax=Actinoplanes couchii TaxID=403638 RepID=A0ABQ3X069_9ACTN|nr:hypothetical protein [Actinoplanes couchii]MDR6316180.1 hypothetical protein [Actinoplanes couchii]GID51795.1 hypothetical protein Aco03nite_001990 [Actinoplanes couchii]
MALACPYCYERINPRRLWFRCTGRKGPGRPACLPRHDPVRRELTGIDELVLPAFPAPGRLLGTVHSAVHEDCNTASGIKVCPHCHSRLPATFGEGDSPLIAMAGAPHTGKSVYLRILADQLRHGMGRRFDADVRLTGDEQFNNESGRADFLDVAGDLFPNGQLYAKTQAAVSGRRDPVVFAWRQRRRIGGHSTTFLSFFDTAGEDLAAMETVDNLRYLGAADALILLLDPFLIPRARQEINLPESAYKTRASTVDVLNRVTDNLRESRHLGGRKNIPIPVAVVFAKIDAFFDLWGQDHPLVRKPQPGPFYDETAGRATHEYVRAQLAEWGADDIDNHLIHNYKQFRYFAVSALGIEPDYDNDLVNPRGVHPFRVDEPLLWLLNRFNVVPGKG